MFRPFLAIARKNFTIYIEQNTEADGSLFTEKQSKLTYFNALIVKERPQRRCTFPCICVEEKNQLDVTVSFIAL